MSHRSRAAALVVLVLFLGAIAGSPPAVAHEVDPAVRTVIDEVDPAVDGVVIEVGTSVTTQLLASNETDQVLEVLADTGEPFLRIGPDGVEANLASPSWYVTNQPFGAQAPAPGTDPEAPPRWGRVSTEPAWGWFDHRLHPTDVSGTLDDIERPTFEIPMRYGGRPLVVRGHLEQRTTTPAFGARLTAAPDASTGLTVQLASGRAPALFARYDGDGEVVVDGAEGEPFLRLSSAGAEVNRRSGTWAFTAQARQEDLGGLDVDPTAAPDWHLVDPSPSYAWLDPRAVIEDVGEETVQRRWTVPVTVDGSAEEIAGLSVATVVPLAEAAGLDDDRPGWLVPFVVLAAVGTVAVAGVLLWSRRTPGGTRP